MMPAPEPSRRPKLIGAAVLVATLVAGALAGAAADRLLTQRAALAEGRPADPCAGRPSHGPPFFFETLKLTPEQRAQVEGILERRRGQMDGLWQEARPQMRALIDSTESEIERILTPEQRVEFDRLREEKRKLHAKERHGWSPTPAVEGRGSRPPPPGSGPREPGSPPRPGGQAPGAAPGEHGNAERPGSAGSGEAPGEAPPP